MHTPFNDASQEGTLFSCLATCGARSHLQLSECFSPLPQEFELRVLCDNALQYQLLVRCTREHSDLLNQFPQAFR
jgi:hypothetical protein